ncbi:MAG: cytochrome c [Lewinella sp.]|nr:cytochrome c [Lewinella sp.]
MKKLFVLLPLFALAYACGGPESGDTGNQADRPRPKSMIEQPAEDDGKGVGPITEVSLNDPLNAAMVEAGKGIYELKCAACHKLTDQRVVGPGWAGVTDRRQPEWIMNMTMNVDVMLAEDPAAQELLKECLVRMPNQNLTEEDAREVLEFMYANDGGNVGG